MHHFSPEQLHQQLLKSGNHGLLLDVREAWEYGVCHIPDSINIPMSQIAAQYSDLDPQQETVVICHHGIRSRAVASFLEQAGFKNVINLSGGVAAWAQTVDPSMPTY